MTRTEWRDLSDSELRVKLSQRDLSAMTVDVMVRHRDDPDISRVIERHLNP